MEASSTQVEVKIGALIVDPNTNTPIVVLKGVNAETVLPIWVGSFEANAIALEIEKVASQRPMTHDLLRNVIIECGLSAVGVIITDLVENTFFARIELIDSSGSNVFLDARPSDAIALALRMDCPIFVENHVIELSAQGQNPPSEPSADEITSDDDWPEMLG